MSYLYTNTSQGASTATGLSTQILIQVDGQGVGAVQSMSIQQNRPLRRLGEVGTDGSIEVVPNGPTSVTLSVDRIVFDKKRMTEAFSRSFLNIHAQRIPFDVFVYDFSDAVSDTALDANPAKLNLGTAFDAPSNAEGVITTVYENCWFESLSTSYTTDYIISESSSIWCEFVRSFKDGKQNNPASRGEPALFDALEALADRGRRGSLDGRGLGRLSDTFSNLLNP